MHFIGKIVMLKYFRPVCPLYKQFSSEKCGKGRIPKDVFSKILEAYYKLEKSHSQSLLKKYLLPEVFECLKDVQTPRGSTILDCIQSGVQNPDSGIGLYAPDADAYSVFHELFYPLICDYHRFKNGKHPAPCWGKPEAIQHLDNKYVISTRIRCGRSLDGYPFAATMSEKDYEEVEQKIMLAVNSLDGDLRGNYYPLKLMQHSEQTKLIEEQILYKEGDRFLQAANICRFWPRFRGIFYNAAKDFIVWVNEEDHIRIISMEKGGDITSVYKRFVLGVEHMTKCLRFVRSEKYGFLTSCPTNIGTSMRASVHVSFPCLGANRAKLEEEAAKYNLQVRGTAGEHTESVGNVYDISNKRRLGITEFMAIKEMCDGVCALIKLEEEMQQNLTNH